MSIQKKTGKHGNSYQVRYRLADGKQVAKNFSTKKDALSFESQVRITKNQGLLVGASFTKVFFKDFVNTWRETKAVQRPRTIARREGIIRNYLIPESVRREKLSKFSNLSSSRFFRGTRDKEFSNNSPF